jgi:hypothetical protein
MEVFKQYILMIGFYNVLKNGFELKIFNITQNKYLPTYEAQKRKVFKSIYKAHDKSRSTQGRGEDR